MGRQILNLFPLPDPALVGNPVTQGNYNYQFAGDTEKLRRDHVVRADWNIRPGTTFYTRIQTGKEVFGRGQYNETAPALIAGAGMGFPWSEGSYDINTAGYVATLTHTFTGSTVLEVIAGTNWADPGRVSAGTVRLGCPRLSQPPAGAPAVLHREQPQSHPAGHDLCRRQRPSEHEGHQHRPGPGVPVAGVEPCPQLLGQPDPPARQAQPQGRLLLRTQQPAGRDVEQCGHVQLQLRRGQSARHQSGLGERAARAPQHLHREQQQHPVDAAVQSAGVLRSGQLAAQPEVHPRCRRALLTHRRRPRAWSRHRLVRPQRLGSGQGGPAVAAALRQRRVSLHRRQSRRPQSADGRAAAESLDRRGGRRIGRHQQRHGVRQGTARHVPRRGDQDRAASRVRLGRLRRRQDRGPRRLRHQLQPAGRRPVWRLHRGHEPDGELAVDDDR